MEGMKSLPFDNLWMMLLVRTMLLGIFVLYIIKKDFALRNLPLIGKYFR